jgi:hypothetical protein
VELKCLSHLGQITIIGTDINVKKQTVGESVFFLILNSQDISSDKTSVSFGVYSEGKLIEEITSTFVGPITP